jgi:hypothetical protein
MPECTLCGEDVDRVVKCSECGERFCDECGEPSEKLCVFCLDEESEEEDYDNEDYEDEEDEDWK